jgi:predicted Zn finger-like uncharacterized protein
MNLTCPSCDTTFRIDGERLGDAGRWVRCGACGTTWFQDRLPAPAEPDRAADEPAAEPAGATEALAEKPAEGAAPAAPSYPDETHDGPATAPSEDIPTRDAPPDDSAAAGTTESDQHAPGEAAPTEDAAGPAPDEPTAAAAPPTQSESPRRARTPRGGAGASTRVTLGWVLFLAVVAALAGGFYFGQQQIVARVPAMARLYDLVGLGAEASADLGLELREVTSAPRLVDGTRVVVIEGLIANVADGDRDVPALRARLLGSDGKSLDQWTFEAEIKRLPPGGTTRFATTAQNPPRDGRLSIEFVGSE